VPERFAQVTAGSSDPGPRIRVLRIAHVIGCQLGASQGALTHVELHHRFRRLVAAESAEPPQQPRGRVRAAEPRDVQRELRHLRGRVEQAQLTVELQAIDDAARIAGVHVFRAKVPVSFHHSQAPAGKLAALRRKVAKLGRGDLAQQRLADGVLQPGERAAVPEHLAPHSCEVPHAADRPSSGIPVEPRQQERRPVQARAARGSAGKNDVQHLPGRQPAHFDQVILDARAAADLQAARPVGRQRHHRLVHRGGQAPVEPQLRQATPPAAGQRAVVHAVVMQRLLQLISMRSRQEHPREMSFDGLDVPGSIRIAPGVAQKGDFGFQTGSGRVRAHAKSSRLV